MTNLAIVLNRLKKFSLLLFIFPSTAIIFSLIIHNYFVSFNFSAQVYYQTTSANLSKISCNKANNFCSELKYVFKNKNNDLFDCIENEVEVIYNYNNVDYYWSELEQNLNFNPKKLKELKFIKSSNANLTCIKNSNIFLLYDNFKSLANLVYKLRKQKTFFWNIKNGSDFFLERHQ